MLNTLNKLNVWRVFKRQRRFQNPSEYRRWSFLVNMLKVGLSPSKKKIICLNYSPSKMMKYAYYFILKALFILKMFKFLSWLFGHLEKTAWFEKDKINLETYDVNNKLQYTYCSISHKLKATRQWNLVS